MTYDNDVKVNGKWYKAGEDVPALVATANKVEPNYVDKHNEKEVVKKPTSSSSKGRK